MVSFGSTDFTDWQNALFLLMLQVVYVFVPLAITPWPQAGLGKLLLQRGRQRLWEPLEPQRTTRSV